MLKALLPLKRYPLPSSIRTTHIDSWQGDRERQSIFREESKLCHTIFSSFCMSIDLWVSSLIFPLELPLRVPLHRAEPRTRVLLLLYLATGRPDTSIRC